MCVYLILRFYSNRENSMLAKYTPGTARFTVFTAVELSLASAVSIVVLLLRD